MESRGGWASGAIEFTRNGALASFQGGSRRMFIKMRDMTKTLAFAFDRWDVLEGGVFRVGDERLNLTKGGVAEPTWRHVDSSCLVGG